MSRFDFNKTLAQSSEAIRVLSVLNPLTIRQKGTRSKAIFALALVCFFWGTTWLASKEGVRYMPALELAGIRQFVAGLLYVLFFIIKGAPLPTKKDWLPILVLSFLNFMLSNVLSTWGVKYISAGLGSIIGAIFPLWLVVIGLFAAKTSIPRKAIIGLLLGFGGVCIIFYEHLNDFLNAEFKLGILLSLAATISWAFGTLYTKRKAASFNPYFSLGLQMLISGIAVFTISGFDEKFLSLRNIPWQSWASIAFLIIFGSVIAFVCYLYALQNLPTEQASIYAYINPMVAVILGALLFNEKITFFIIAGGIVTLFGVYLVNKAYRITCPEQPEAEGI